MNKSKAKIKNEIFTVLLHNMKENELCRSVA